MKKEDEIKTVVPALRFPEFRSMNEWEENKLNSLCDIINGKCNAQDHVEGGKYPLFDRSATMKYSNDYLYDCEAIIIPGEGVKFVPKYYIGKFNLHQRAYALKDFSCNGRFLFYSMEYYSGLLAIKAVKSTVLSLRLPILQNFLLYIPNNNTEQQKIADCLSSLDDLIEATAQKVEVLKEYKKGLMQRLFPAEGKNVPDLRFPEFQGMKGWEKKQVKDFGEVITGNTPSKKEGKYWNGDFVWVTAQDFKGKYINDSILKLTKFGKDKARVIPKDSVLVTCIASIGLNAINKVECSTNQQINTICCNKEYYYEYVYYLVTYNTKNLKQLAGQTAVPIITKKSFEEFEVYAIDNYDEQQKIADSLSSLDELIEVISRKVEILKEYKKGLMQQLFPKI